MKKIRKIGYRAVQASGIGAISEKELMKILDGEGLVCCATHENVAKLISEPQAIVERLRKLRCKYTACPHPGDRSLKTEAEVAAFAGDLDAAGKVLAAAGQVLTYHNHALEFKRVGSKTVLEHIYDCSAPRHLAGEIDTYWVQYGGGDPVEWCRRLKGRLPLLHMKDFAVAENNAPVMAEIGNGNLNWKEIVRAADEAGCEWYLVEQDICPADPFDSLRQSFEFIAGNLCCC